MILFETFWTLSQVRTITFRPMGLIILYPNATILKFSLTKSSIFQAYFIRDWRHLYWSCTLPYFIVLLFWKFIPESLRTLAIKGKSRQLMQTLRRMAKFNNRHLPEKFTVVTESNRVTSQNSNPLDLFRTWSLAKKTLCQIMGYVVGGMTFYGLYLAGKDPPVCLVGLFNVGPCIPCRPCLNASSFTTSSKNCTE